MNFLLIFVGFLVFIFAPFEMYLANTEELWYNIFDFGGYLLVAFAIYLIAVIITDHILKRNILYKTLGYFVFVLGAAFYVQGNFVVFDYGELDGIAIDWSRYGKEGVISVAIFLLIILLGLVIYYSVKDKEKLYKWTNNLAICMILVQAVTLITLIISNNGLDDKVGYIVTDREETNYSKNENYIVIVLDTYDARVFDDLYKGGFKDDMEDTFKNFTWYRNTVSTYRLTDFSLPEVLTGEYYLNGVTYGEYLEESYSRSDLIRELKNREYSVNLYISTPIPQGEAAKQIENWDVCKIHVSSHRRLLEYIYKLVGFRYMPQPLKRYFWTYTGEIDDLRIVEYDGDSTINPVSWGNDRFRDSISQIQTEYEGDKFSLIHLRGIHAPRTLDAKFNKVEEGVSLWESAQGMNLMLSEYLDKLRELGIYDNSTIVIMADHGAYDYDEGYASSPLLMVKYKGAAGDFDIDETPMSFVDMQRILITLLDRDIKEVLGELSAKGDRLHYETEWSTTLKANERAKEFVEYAVKGHAFDVDKIVATGNSY